MNKRIKELADEVGLKIEYQMINPPKPFQILGSTEQFEKFTELLIKECHETIKKDMELAQIQLLPLDFGMYANGRLRRIIKEHFGVE